MASHAVLVSRIPQITKAAHARAAAIVAKTAADIEAAAKMRAPVDTGYLRSSIHTQPTGPLDSEVIAGADYAVYVEYGTRRMAPQPYMTPAAEAARPGFEQAAKQIYK